MQPNSIIEFRGVSYLHPNGRIALQDINLTISPGEVLAIVGANGAGKTTLIKHINGLLKPTQGSVHVFGMDTKKASVAVLSKRVGIVFQNSNHQLFADTVENEVRFALKNFGFAGDVIQNRVEWALEFFNLVEYRKTSPFILSGGEKKRLTIAAVMAWKPDVIIFDEPTVGQDFNQKEKLQQVVQQLKEQGRTVVVVSHDTEFLWPLQARTIAMADGRIQADGEAKQVFGDDELVRRANLAKPQLLELWFKLKVKPEAPFASVHEALVWLHDSNLKQAGGDLCSL